MPVRIGSVSSSVQNQTRARIQSKSDKNAENAVNIIGGHPTKNVPGPGRTRVGSTLTARDANARAGSRSSVSSQDGDRFYTANKEPEAKQQSDKYRKSKVYRNSMKSQIENIVPQVLVNETSVEGTADASPSLRKGHEVVLNPAGLGSFDDTYAISKEDSIVEDVDDVEECLPTDVLNIEIDEGLYEYSREAYEYLKDHEKAYVIPQDYLDTGAISVNMRMILVDWLTQVQHHLKLTQESLYLTVSILDTIINRRDVDADKLQLLGITAMLLATKLEEYYPAEVGKLLHLTENSYTREEVVNMERVLIQILNFKVYIPSPQVFLLRYARAALRSMDDLFYDTCNFIMDTHLLLANHSCFPASQSAGASILLSSLLYYVSANDNTDIILSPSVETIWTPTLVHFSGYSHTDLLQISLEMVNQMILTSAEDFKFRGAVNKYTSQSQHQKLATHPHVQKKVLKKARRVVLDWS